MTNGLDIASDVYQALPFIARVRQDAPALLNAFLGQLKQKKTSLDNFAKIDWKEKYSGEKRARAEAFASCTPGLVVGRVLLQDGGDPREVCCQMRINEGGFYTALVGDVAGSLHFQCHGYHSECVPLAEYASQPTSEYQQACVWEMRDVLLKRCADGDLTHLTGTLEVEDAQIATPRLQDAKVSVKPTVPVERINMPLGALLAEPRSNAQPLVANVSPTGCFELHGCTVGVSYSVDVQLTGFMPAYCTTKADGQMPIKLALTELPGMELPWAAGGYADAVSDAKAGGRRVVLMLSGSTCGPCINMKNTTLRTERARAALAPYALAFEVDNQVLRDQFGVKVVPTFLLIDPGNERCVGEFTGFRDEAGLEAELAKWT